MRKFKLVISAIPVGHGGAGDYLDYIIKTHKGYVFLAPLVPALNKEGIIYKLLYKVQGLAIKLVVGILAKFTLIDSVVFHHPQTLGYKLATSLIKSANTVDYWVLDTSFFCKQSYNYHNNKACFRCIHLFNPCSDCKYFPRLSVDGRYLRFLRAVTDYSEKITFHVQTAGYDELLKYRYGGLIKVTHEKMIVPGFSHIISEKAFYYDFEFGFHANLFKPKGFLYALALARKLLNARFFIPGNRPKNVNSPANVFYMPCSWSSGLDKRLVKCKIILCPSIWTAPVEAAVIKSMLIGRPVGLISSQYNLSCEIPPDCFVPLTGDTEKDSVLLKSLLADNHILDQIGVKGQEWAREYINDRD